jgi:hypothetical protein
LFRTDKIPVVIESQGGEPVYYFPNVRIERSTKPYVVKLTYGRPGRKEVAGAPARAFEFAASMVVTRTRGFGGVRVITYVIEAETPEQARTEALQRGSLLARHLKIKVEPEVTVERLGEEAAS